MWSAERHPRSGRRPRSARNRGRVLGRQSRSPVEVRECSLSPLGGLRGMKTIQLALGLAAILVLVTHGHGSVNSGKRGIVKTPLKVSRQGNNWRLVLAPGVEKAIATGFPGYSVPRFAWFDDSLS